MSAMKFTGILAAAAIVAVQSNCAAQAQQQWGNGHKWGAGAETSKSSSGGALPETELLYKNDGLVPTQNRTQSMRLEAENGHVNPQVDSALQPIIKKQRQQVAPPHVVKKKPAKARNTWMILHSQSQR